MNRLFIIDLMPILYRGYFVFMNRPPMTATGINTACVSLLATTLVQILKEQQPTHIAFAAESLSPTFRHQMYPLYKAQRDKAPEDIIASIPMATELAQALGIPVIRVEGYEADDVLGTLATRGVADGFEVFIASPDKDLGQLAGDHVSIYRDGKVLSAQDICDKFGLSTADQVIDYLALTGDASDNIPGLPGVGPKTAVKLLQDWGSFEGVLAHAGEIKGKLGEKIRDNEQIARLSYDLVTIRRDVPMVLAWDEIAVKPIDATRLAPVLGKYELNQVANRLGVAFASSARSTASTNDLGDLPLFAQHAPAKDTVSATLAPASHATLVTTNYDSVKTIEHTYTCVQTEEQWDELLCALQAAERFAFDTETTGLNPRADRAVGCSFATAPHRAWYVPFPEDDWGVEMLLKRFTPIFADRTKVVIGHNLKFDRQVLQHYGFDFLGICHDTILAHYLIDATDRHNMDHLARQYLNYDPIPISQLIGEKKDGNMAQLKPETIADYAAEDADVTLQLEDVLRPLVAQKGLIDLLEQCEEPLQNVLLKMENAGVTIDQQALRLFGQELEGELLTLDAAIRAYAPGTLNIASPKQIGTLLFDTLKIDPYAKKTATGQFKTDEETLLKLRDAHPIVDLILDYRACQKLKNTYVDKLPTHIDPQTGKIHTTFNQAFTETGRLSSSNPNLQNIPVRSDRGQRIREAIVASDRDHVLIAADYSQVELRIMAEMSQDPTMLQAFADGVDIHTQTASKVYGIPMDQVTPQQRSYCKMVNFGIIYGISSYGLSQRLRIPVRDATTLIDSYFAHYPKIKEFMEQAIAIAKEKGYAKTLLGRRRLLPDLASRNGTTRKAAERIAINMPVQGTAADIIKQAMIRMDQALTQASLKTTMILQIHDELLFDVPKDEEETVRALIQQVFTETWPLKAPLDLSVGTGPNWHVAH